MKTFRIFAMSLVLLAAACSDQSKQQQNSTSSLEPNPQVDIDKTPDSSTGGDSQTKTGGTENKPNPAKPVQ